MVSSPRQSAGAGSRERLLAWPGCETDVSPRRRLMAAMAGSVVEQGYDATTVDDVLERADLPREVFDRFFRGTDDCFVQAIDEVADLLRRVVVQAYAGDAPWPYRVRTGLETFLSALATNPEWTRLAMVESSAAGHEAMVHYRRAFESFLSFFEEGRLQAADPERVPPMTAAVVVAGIASVVQRWVTQGDVGKLVALLPDLVYFALVPYVGHQQAISVAQAEAA